MCIQVLLTKYQGFSKTNLFEPKSPSLFLRLQRKHETLQVSEILSMESVPL